MNRVRDARDQIDAPSPGGGRQAGTIIRCPEKGCRRVAVSARGCRVHEEVHTRIDRIEAKLERVRQLLADPDAVERLRASLKREATSSG